MFIITVKRKIRLFDINISIIVTIVLLGASVLSETFQTGIGEDNFGDIWLRKSDERQLVQYLQVPEPDGLYYYPYLSRRSQVKNRGFYQHPTYATSRRDELGNSVVFISVPPGRQLLHLERDRNDNSLFIYNHLSIDRGAAAKQHGSQISATHARIVPQNRIHRVKRSPGKLSDLVRDTHQTIKDGVNNLFRRSGRTKTGDSESPRKVIHLPALFIDKEKDGFEHVFYQDMIVAALCLTNRPELDRHEIRDEYEAVVCRNKGYASVIPDDTLNEAKKRSITVQKSSSVRNRRRRREVDDEDKFHYHDADSAKFHLDKNKYDTLWKTDNNLTTTPLPIQSEIVEDLNYDYEFSDESSANGTKGWEEDEVVDPEDLDFIGWPHFLPVTGEEKVQVSDQFRSNLHHHTDKNYTLDELHELLKENHSEVIFDRLKFALNDSHFLGAYYTDTFYLWSYNFEKIIDSFFLNRERTLSSFYPVKNESKLNLDSLRQLFILFIIDVHHVNCFNRHIRYYGYVMKRPGSINGDEITNNGRLSRGIIMRALELLRHIPQYNIYKELFLRLLIAALKERALSVKHSTKHVEENDYTELFEVASYLEHLIENGIHPDEKNQDLFVQETRFYAHHFMNTLTLR